MHKSIKIVVILIISLFLISFAIFTYVLKPYVTSTKSGTKEKMLCLVSTQVSSDGLINFFKTRIFGYDLLETEIKMLKKEVEYLNHLLETRINK